MSDRKTELEKIVRERAEQIRELTEQNARDAEELRGMHDLVSWLTFLSTTMPKQP